MPSRNRRLDAEPPAASAAAVARLAAILRIANALDRTHAARVVELHSALSRPLPDS